MKPSVRELVTSDQAAGIGSLLKHLSIYMVLSAVPVGIGLYVQLQVVRTDIHQLKNTVASNRLYSSAQMDELQARESAHYRELTNRMDRLQQSLIRNGAAYAPLYPRNRGKS